MKPPVDRPTPKEAADSTQVRLAAMNVPESLAFVIDSIKGEINNLRLQGHADAKELRIQQNAAMGKLYRRLETWRDDLRRAISSDIEIAMRQHVAEYHGDTP